MEKTVQPASVEEAIIALHDPKVIELDCADLLLGAAEFEKLAPHLAGSAITELHLWNCHIGTAGVVALASILPFTNIRKLSIPSNLIGDRGAKMLAETLPHCQVAQLDLAHNEIGSEGAQALATALPLSNISLLHLQRTSLAADDVQVIINALPTSQVSVLDIRNNRANDANVQSLIALLPHCAITNVLVDGTFTSIDENGDIAQHLDRASQRATQLWENGNIYQEWSEFSQNMHFVQQCARNDGLSSASITDMFIALAEEACARGLSAQDVALKALPLAQAKEWLEAHDQPLSAADLLNPDGTFPTDRFVCQQGMLALCQQPDLWESRAQAVAAIHSLPEAQQALLPRHQLMATLGQRDAAKQQGRA